MSRKYRNNGQSGRAFATDDLRVPMDWRGGTAVHMSFAEAFFDDLWVEPFLWGIDTLQHMMNVG